MRDLPQRMDTCVGPARALDEDLLLRDLRGGIVQRTLNRRHTRLLLPAVKIRPVVRQRNLDIAHGLPQLSHAERSPDLARLASRGCFLRSPCNATPALNPHGFQTKALRLAGIRLRGTARIAGSDNAFSVEVAREAGLVATQAYRKSVMKPKSMCVWL